MAEETGAAGTISEAAFLLTELRYTLGQVHVQTLDLDSSAMDEKQADEDSIDGILRDMIERERQYEARYGELLHSAPPADPSTIPVPLPIAEAGTEAPGPVAEFEHARAATLAQLSRVAPDEWPDEVVHTVKEQVQCDREHTTAIAERRRTILDRGGPIGGEEPLVEE